MMNKNINLEYKIKNNVIVNIEKQITGNPQKETEDKELLFLTNKNELDLDESEKINLFDYNRITLYSDDGKKKYIFKFGNQVGESVYENEYILENIIIEESIEYNFAIYST